MGRRDREGLEWKNRAEKKLLVKTPSRNKRRSQKRQLKSISAEDPNNEASKRRYLGWECRYAYEHGCWRPET